MYRAVISTIRSTHGNTVTAQGSKAQQDVKVVFSIKGEELALYLELDAALALAASLETEVRYAKR